MDEEISNKFSINDTNKLSKDINNNIQYSKINTEEDSLNEKSNEKTNDDTINSNINSNKNKKSKYFFYSKLGCSYAFFGNINGDPLIIIGPSYYIIIQLLLFITFIYSCFFYTFWKMLSYNFQITGILIYSIFCFSYLYTSLINPGYPKNNLESKNGGRNGKYYWCHICNIWISQEKKVKHCAMCGYCVEEFDHHCSWTNKCIAKKICILFIFLF